eukprot:1177254-Rhodomonas_salina.1
MCAEIASVYGDHAGIYGGNAHTHGRNSSIYAGIGPIYGGNAGVFADSSPLCGAPIFGAALTSKAAGGRGLGLGEAAAAWDR